MEVARSTHRTSSRRRSHSVPRAAGDGLEQSLGFAIELLLGCIIVLSPLAFGSVEFWAQWWMMLFVGVATIALLVRWVAYPRTFQPAFTVAYIPMALFLLLAVAQWLSVPDSVVSIVSPKAAAAWQDVSQLLPGQPIHRTISLYPLATERQLRLLLLVCSVFVIVFSHVREREQIVRILWAILISGILVGLVAISQHLSNGPSTWWRVPMAHAHSGPFMNHSAFGQFMNLATGAALALLLIGLKRQIGDRVMSFRSLKHHLIRKSSLSLLVPLIFILVAPVLVALSMTRGGVLSIVIAGGVTGVLLGATQSGRGKRALIAVLAFLVLLVMLKFGFDRVYDRMATLQDAHETGGGVRLQMLRDMLPIVKDFPILGVGLGAFSHVFPSYDTAAIATFATHAENEYAQLAVETGLVGASLCALFLVIIAFNAYAAVRFGRRSIHAGTVGLIFGLLAILIHSASDFGQHVPAIACVTAAISALLVRLGNDARADRAPLVEPIAAATSSRARFMTITAIVLLLASCVWSIGRTTTESDAEASWMASKQIYLELERRGLGDASDGEFIQAIQGMAKTVELVPGDAEYRYGLNAMRWQSIDRYDRGLTAEFLAKISDECLKISEVAPCFGPSITFAGQVRAFDLKDPVGIPLIRKGFALARYSREASFAVATLDARDGKWDACVANLRRAIELGTPRSTAARMLVLQHQRIDLALELVNGSRPDMVALAQTLDRIGQTEEATRLLNRTTEMLIAEASQPDAPVDALVQLADAYIREDHHADAIPLLRRALIVRFDRSDWRMSLIQALVAVGDTAEAEREARTNYRLNPGNAQAKQMLEDVVVAPTTQLTRPR